MADQRVNDLKGESIPDLLRQLAIETTTLVRQEVDLAKAELGEKVRVAGAGAGMFGGAAVFGLGAFGALTAAIIAAIALALPVWAAALIVAVAYGVVASIAVQNGRHKIARAAPVVPQQTTQTVKEDIEWVKTRAQSGRR